MTNEALIITKDCVPRCSHCDRNQESTKQLTLQKLPVVASFHLKRFEHSSRLHKKITTRVDFPEIIDMSPFITGSRNTRKGDGKDLAEPNNKYVLFAVINHIGTLDAGHYTSYIRHSAANRLIAEVVQSRRRNWGADAKVIGDGQVG